MSRPQPNRQPLASQSPGVLAITSDPGLAARLAGLAATAGVMLTHRDRLAAGSWLAVRESLVLVGPDVDPPASRRPGLVLVCTGEPAPDVWRRAVELGAEDVAVLPDAEPWLLERLVDAASPGPRAPVLGVVGGRGGAGASTLAVALSCAGAGSGRRTLLVDADPFGGGLDLLIGAEGDPGLRWPDLAGARGRLQPGALAACLPEAGGVWVLSWDRDLPEGRSPGGWTPDGPQAEVVRGCPPPVGGLEPDGAAIETVVRAATCEFDLVVIDLSRRFSTPDLVAAGCCDLTLLVVPAEVRATAAAGRVAAVLEQVVADQRLVVRGPAPSGLCADAVADALGLPLAGEIRWEPAVSAAMDRGEPVLRPRGSLSVLARRVVAGMVAT